MVKKKYALPKSRNPIAKNIRVNRHKVIPDKKKKILEKIRAKG